MKILFFAQTRTATGCGEWNLETTAPMPEYELWQNLITQFPALEPLRHSTRLARNSAYTHPGELFAPDDEVALIPPVSGG